VGGIFKGCNQEDIKYKIKSLVTPNPATPNPATPYATQHMYKDMGGEFPQQLE